jgi:hypothetical protein
VKTDPVEIPGEPRQPEGSVHRIAYLRTPTSQGCANVADIELEMQEIVESTADKRVHVLANDVPGIAC